MTRRLTARAGLRFNTIGDRGWGPAVSAGVSYAVFGAILVDGQITGGSDNAFRGLGVSWTVHLLGRRLGRYLGNIFPVILPSKFIASA